MKRSQPLLAIPCVYEIGQKGPCEAVGLDGILRVLGTGAPWHELPKKSPYQICDRRFRQWVREGKLERMLRPLARKLQSRGKLQLEGAVIDACFTDAKKGGSRSGPTERR